jgi:hypothetical protein
LHFFFLATCAEDFDLFLHFRLRIWPAGLTGEVGFPGGVFVPEGGVAGVVQAASHSRNI